MRVAWRTGRRAKGSSVSTGSARNCASAAASAFGRVWIANQCISSVVVIGGAPESGDLRGLLKRGEILRGDAVKNMAAGGWLLLENTLRDQLLHGLRNLGRPASDARVEHPPMQDAVDRVLRIRMSGEIIQNFRRRRWEQGLG